MNKYFLVFIFIINFKFNFSLPCSNCPSVPTVCSSNVDCFKGYCEEGTCKDYIACSSSTTSIDSCPVDTNNFMCISDQCIPTSNQPASAQCKNDANCITNKCSDGVCLEDTCGSGYNTMDQNKCKWTKYCNRFEVPDINTGGTLIKYGCQSKGTNSDCSDDNICSPGYKCSADKKICVPIFSGSIGQGCLIQTNDDINSLLYCDIGKGLVCKQFQNQTGYSCEKYQSSSCNTDSDCPYSPFEKCSCDGVCISKYNLNNNCKDAITKAYQCASTNDSPTFSNGFYNKCSKEACEFVNSCIGEKYDNLTCHTNSFTMCPSFSWSKPTEEPSNSSNSSSSSNSSNSSSQPTKKPEVNDDPNTSNSLYSLNYYFLLFIISLVLLI
ncbi:hypothetical protein DICPUDRAFT_154295 [Dictyostelium purpureum]|uniref:Dickkopf N-terminal cysteine-rich domain-containing protein n=1 Tax=Dictyostelium purpureum TaxID=5786 RepID=F0ZQZ0_DICPU|nr:uncharacterized protein DICPUDRAFT_154295 [Dictyostelium purpureum]EGC33650.1 hypothetical protein DICPUDRAFT_154295 [Dictyostelium purpureum]|eukprot:XP_003289820.1 hypothetical protein DICPUDRAFT_154295 [Dictyostelium purpureum]